MADPSVKEVMMDMPESASGGTRRRRRRGARRTVQAGGDNGVTMGAAVEKVDAPAPAPILSSKELAPLPAVGHGLQAGGGAPKKAPVVVLAPPKKKPTKIMLVPKGKMKKLVRKTFKAKRVHLTIDNTAKTVKHRCQVLGRVDAMTDDQVRAAAVAARLTSRERVAKAPIALLRQMIRDYHTMKGMLL